MMGREKFVKYPYDDDLYEMIPTSFSQTSLRDQEIMWTTHAPQVTQSADEAPDSNYLNRLWNEDFSHRPSWCDAKLALEQIKRGRASGNKPALYFRSFLQTVLFNMGKFIQAHSPIVIMIGMIVLFIFAVGLKDATIETDIDKLWVQKHGRLHDEREYVKNAFKSEILRNEEWEKLNVESMVNKNGSGFSTINEDLANKAGQEQFLMLIQTAKKRGGTIGKEDFLLHERTMSEISQLSIELFNQTWKLADICFKPAAPDIPDELKVLFDKLLKGLLPCVMITPLDCFWDGAKPNGPDPPIPLNHLAGMLDSLPGPTISWKNFDPAAALNEAYDLLGIPTLETVITLFKRVRSDSQAGINDAYQGRPCLEPLDPECPKKSPNYVDICTIVDDFLKYNVQHNDLYGLGVGNDHSVSSMLKTHTNESENLNSTALSTDDIFVPFDSPQDKKEKCEKYAGKIRKILLSDKNLYDSFLPAWSKIDFAKKLTGSCKGFAENFMRWPQDLIIGGVKRDHDKISSFEAIESVYMLASPHDIYARIDAEKLQDLDRPWTLETANDVLDTWQRHFADYVYKHKNNSDDSRILHPLAGTSVNDMLKEFSKFNPTVIIIGYIFMIFYASLSLCSFSDRGVRSGVGLGMAGCLLVTLAGVAGLGCSMMLNVPFNAATTQIVPFLTLGLGVDDMFLLVHSYRDIVRVARKDEIGFLLKETGLSALLTSINNILAFLAGGFLPVPALRDFCLQVALLLTFNAISILTIYPAMMNIDLLRRKNRRVDVFCCIKAAPSSSTKKVNAHPEGSGHCNTSVENKAVTRTYSEAAVQAAKKNRDSMTAGNDTDLAKMRSNSAILHTDGQQNDKLNAVDNCGNIYRNESCLTVNNYDTMNSTMSYSQNCLTAPIDDSSVQGTLAGGATILSKPEFESGYSCKHMTLHRFVSDVYNVWLSKTSVKIGVLIFNGVLLASGLVGCSRIVLGLELTDVIPKGTAAYAFLDARERFFSFYPFNGIIKGPIDLPSKQALIYEYREKLGDVKYVVKQDGKVQEQFWLDLMRVWLQQLQQHFDDNIAQDKLIANFDKNTGISKDASEEAILAYKLLCNAGSVLNCSKANASRLVDENGIINKDGFYNYLTAWVNQDPMTYHVSQAAMSPKPPYYKFNTDMTTIKNMTVPPAKNLLFSRIPFFSYGLVDTPTIVDMIQEARSICEDFTEKGLPNFPDGLPFTFWEQYLDLRYNLVIALMMVIGSVFIVISILLINPWTSAVVVFVLFVLVVELAGFMGAVGLKLNAVSSVSLITAVGIGVEFTVHISLSYLTTLGSRNERMASTLNHMFIPVLHGGLSTLLGVIMLAFSEFEFIVRYFFMVMSALIVLGIINGLVLLPVLLSVVGPNSEVRTTDGSHYLPPPTPPAPQKFPHSSNKQAVQSF